jgi:stage II sporulation protein M
VNIFKRRLGEHLQSNWWVYLFVSLCFLIGVVFGATGVKSLNQDQQTALLEFVNQGLSGLAGDYDPSVTASQALFKNIYNLLKILVLGLTVIGFPVILAIIFTRGFVLGFTVAFMIQEKAFQGVLLALLTIVPPNLIALPAYFLSAVMAINFSLYLVRGSGQRSVPLSQYFLGYLAVSLLLGLLMTGAAIIEGYFSPFMIRFMQ